MCVCECACGVVIYLYTPTPPPRVGPGCDYSSQAIPKQPHPKTEPRICSARKNSPDRVVSVVPRGVPDGRRILTVYVCARCVCDPPPHLRPFENAGSRSEVQNIDWFEWCFPANRRRNQRFSTRIATKSFQLSTLWIFREEEIQLRKMFRRNGNVCQKSFVLQTLTLECIFRSTAKLYRSLRKLPKKAFTLSSFDLFCSLLLNTRPNMIVFSRLGGWISFISFLTFYFVFFFFCWILICSLFNVNQLNSIKLYMKII